jgi:multicomponent Na+:H+ antiporter subunit D
MQELDVWLVVAYFAAFTIVTASVVALVQDNLKKRLAYSTISQLSYIILGGALLTESAMLGGAMHIVNHAFMKITLFFCAGAIYVNTHRKQISQLDGLGRKMPFTFGAFTVGALGMAGIPPVAGFVSKWFLCVGTLEAHEMIFLYTLLASSLLNAGYFFPIVYRAFFKKPAPDDDVKGEASLFMVVPICFTACVSILLFFEPNLPLHFLDLAKTAVAQVANGGW